MRHLVLATVVLGLVASSALWAAAPTEADVEVALRAHLRIPAAAAVPQHISAFVDLNDDGVVDAIVLMDDHKYCGSGGCTLEILRGGASGLKFVSGTTLVLRPISVSPHKSKGWYDILVGSRYVETARLTFDGRRYSLSAERSASSKDEGSPRIVNF
jgi:hypothetical protein